MEIKLLKLIFIFGIWPSKQIPHLLIQEVGYCLRKYWSNLIKTVFKSDTTGNEK